MWKTFEMQFPLSLMVHVFMAVSIADSFKMDVNDSVSNTGDSYTIECLWRNVSDNGDGTGNKWPKLPWILRWDNKLL